jgi:hypothetical protein
MSHISDISAKFGMQALEMSDLPHALFYHFGFGLRFELSIPDYKDGDHIPSFLQAIDRARAITAAVLPNLENITIAISHWGFKRTADRAERRVKRKLKRLGVNVSTLEFAGSVPQEDYFNIVECRKDRYRHWFTLRPANLLEFDKFLWGCISEDLWTRPRLRAIDVYMIDLEREVILQVYDDRGMDVVSTELRPLRPFYRKFSDWILDYDRAQIDAVFKTGDPFRKFGPAEAREHRQSVPPWAYVNTN